MDNSEIVFQRFQDSDADELLRNIDSPELLFLWSGMTFNFPVHKLHFLQVIHKLPYAYLFKIIDAETREFIGYIELSLDKTKYNQKPDTAKIGRFILFSKTLRGKGLGQKILKKLLKFAFNELKLKKIWLKVIEFNEIGIACYKKSGFTVEKTVKDNNKNYDYHMMSITCAQFAEINKKNKRS